MVMMDENMTLETTNNDLPCAQGGVPEVPQDDSVLEKEYTAKRTKEQEEMVEIRRLRTENRLLRQRIDNLEQESSSLADRLIQGQVTRAQEAEEAFSLKRELGAVKQQHVDLQKSFDEVMEKMKMLESSTEWGSKDAEDLISVLQEELVNIRLREAESQAVMKELKTKLHDAEEANKKLRDVPPDNNVAHLQEELISLKLREAEGALSMKELSQRIEDMSVLWEKHLKENHQGENGKKKDYGKNIIAQLQDDLLSAKLGEAKAVASLKAANHRIMELESQNQICLNQLRRQEEETRKLEEKLEEAMAKERDSQNAIKEEHHKLDDLESKMREELMMARIREMERAQTVAELEQKLSSMECKHEELMAARQLSKGSENEEVRELQEKVLDYQTEVLRLEAINKKLTSALAINNSPQRIPVSLRNGDLHHP